MKKFRGSKIHRFNFHLGRCRDLGPQLDFTFHVFGVIKIEDLVEVDGEAENMGKKNKISRKKNIIQDQSASQKI